MIVLSGKAIIIWLLIVIIAIVNAAIREKLLTPVIGSGIALPISGLLLSIFIFLVTYLSIPFFSSGESQAYLYIGILWFTLTLAFEFLFGHFVAGKSWQEILQVFNLRKGNLFVVALITTLIAPWVCAKLRGFI